MKILQQPRILCSSPEVPPEPPVWEVKNKVESSHQRKYLLPTYLHTIRKYKKRYTIKWIVIVKEKGSISPTTHTQTIFIHCFSSFFCLKTLFSHALLVGTRESRSSLESSLCEKWFSAGEIHHNNFLFLVTSAPDFYELLPASLFQLPFVQLKVQLTSIGHYSLGHIHVRERDNQPSFTKNATQWFLKGIPLKCIISQLRRTSF